MNLYMLNNQSVFQELLALGYAEKNILLDSSFLGVNGQVFEADLIVFPDNHVLHINPLLVIEIMSSSESFSQQWLKKWKESGTKVIVWKQSEMTRVFTVDQSNNYYEIYPFIPSISEIENLDQLANKTKDRLKSTLRPAYDLKVILANLHDHFYGNSNIRIPSRLGIEIQKLLLLKKFDEDQPNHECDFCITREELDQYSSDPSESQKVAHQVAERIRTILYQYNQLKDKDQKMNHLELNDESIYYAVLHLEGISLTRTPTDILGDGLETFRSYIMKKEGGQFFTPRPVIQLALNLVEFKGEKHQTLADISCGTSGFLHQARKIIIQASEKTGANQQEQNQVVSDLLLGVEVDQELVQISNTSPEFSSLNHPMVEHHDSLLPFHQWKKSLTQRLQPNSRMLMVGNPPFGTKITIKSPDTLTSFQLARKWKKNKARWIATEQIVPRSPDILFIERNVELLKPKMGKMVLVVPYQILSGPQEGFVREWLMTHCKILAVVDLPEDTFQPYTGTKGSLLVVEKRPEINLSWESEEEYLIFMARPNKIGHDRRGKPVFKDEQQTILDIDLPEISQAYQVFLQGNDPSEITTKAFTISSKLITHANEIRLNAAYYEPKSSNLKQQLFILSKSTSEFAILSLGELVDKIFYPGRFKRNYTNDLDNSVPFLGGSNITQLIPITEKRILKNSPHYEELALQAGWILITRSGTTGIVATVPKDWEGFAASEHIIRIIPNPEKLNAGYLYGYLKSEIGQRLLQEGIFGSVIDEINCNHIASIPVLYPKSLEKANQIGEQILKADLLRYEATQLIKNTTNTIESFIL